MKYLYGIADCLNASSVLFRKPDVFKKNPMMEISSFGIETYPISHLSRFKMPAESQ